MKEPIKLLVVDDSKVMRQVIRKIFDGVPHVHVVGEAAHGKAALEMIPEVSPDVITLDINMPVMDGITALKHIMIRHPRPTVMCSTLTQEGESVTFDSLKYGAVDFIHKPSNQRPESLEQQYASIIKKVTLASQVKIEAVRIFRPKKDLNDLPADNRSSRKGVEYVCAIGASEGGYGALLKILPHLRAGLPMAFITVIHEPASHVDAFVRYLKNDSELRIQRAINGAPLKVGVCYLASGKEYLSILPAEEGYVLQLNSLPLPNLRGCINTVMISAAQTMKNKAIGLILSGAGDDGHEGVAEIIRKGGTAIVQHPDTCLHKEMPRSALNNAQNVLVFPDRDVAAEINQRYCN
jgi:two-component system chemotaxis response regulator CheB